MSLSSSLQDILNCSTHHHLLNAPITLNCGHSVCSGLLPDQPQDGLLRRPSAHGLVCPEPGCVPANLSASVSSILAINVTLQKIITHLLQLSQPSNEPPNLNQTALYNTILSELECSLCSLVFDCPTTTVCGHTFCRTCLLRALDYSDRCPVCRAAMGAPLMRIIETRKPDALINSILNTCFASELRVSQSALPGPDPDKVPLFVCTLAFPHLPVFLHFFEPRYRLLIRRALAHDRRFGSILPSCNFGTLLEIHNIDYLPDGRSLVLAVGVVRFEVIGVEPLDGYSVGTVKWIEDVDQITEERLEADAGPEESIETLSGLCKDFVEVLKSMSTPWTLQQLNNTLGPAPTNPAEFSYWMAKLLPISDDQKAQLLPITTVRLRLKLIVHWIRQFNGGSEVA